jgi:hypothetical protein
MLKEFGKVTQETKGTIKGEVFDFPLPPRLV